MTQYSDLIAIFAAQLNTFDAAIASHYHIKTTDTTIKSLC